MSRSTSDLSLSEVHGSVKVPSVVSKVSFWKRLMAFGGPAYLVSVGYMDPGNWATDLEGGASFGYTLLWVLVMSNMMAVLLQTLSARLGIVAGRDLAQACRDFYPKPVALSLWVLCEIAIIATDLAEVLGTALGLHLLFGIPMIWGVIITILDVFILLALQRYGMKTLELVIISLVILIGGCFLIEIILAKPDVGEMASGLIPYVNDKSLYVAIGIIGATVMPHNLYLHSALVQTRKFDQTITGKQQACKYNLIDSIVALNGAFFINASILILASSVFFANGIVVTEIEQAHELLSPLLGTTMAGILFAVALLASGQSSTLTGTLAGQIVMEGFLRFRIRPVIRRLITRSLAIIPAAVVLMIFGEKSTIDLLILSQVILSMQLSFAVIPLIHFTSDKEIMGSFANKLWVKILAWITAAIVLSLNIKLIIDQVTDALRSDGIERTIGIIALPLLAGAAVLLFYIIFKPLLRRRSERVIPAAEYPVVAGTVAAKGKKYRTVGVAVEGSEKDVELIRTALDLVGDGGDVILMHIVSSAAGYFHKDESRDTQTIAAESYLESLRSTVALPSGVTMRTKLGFGSTPHEIIRLAEEYRLDILVLGAHGHRGLSDVLYGTTVSPVRHALTIPIFIVQ